MIKILRKNRPNRLNNLLVFILTVFIITLCLIFLFSNTNVYSKNIQLFDTVIVERGDTLWSIAANYDSDKCIEELIWEMNKYNDIDNSMIYPGDHIKIPVE